MIDGLSLSIALACVVAALAALPTTATGRFRPERFAGALVVVEVALLVQVVLAVVALLRGHRLDETATFLAYLVVSVLVLPAAAAQSRGAAGRWAGALVIVAFVVQAVIVIRMQTTWRHG